MGRGGGSTVRGSVLVATWSLAAVAATGVALGSVRLVGEQVAGRPPVLTPEAVAELAASVTPAPVAPPQAAQPTSTPPATQPGSTPSAAPSSTQPPTAEPQPTQPTADPPAAEPAPAVRTVTALGGTLAVACEGTRPVLRYATPTVGYGSDVRDSDGGLEVRFRGDETESRVEVVCVGGAPSVEVEEHD